jgi:L-asparaginase
MATFLIINTGGTIGMVSGPNGLEPRDGVISTALANSADLQAWQGHDLIWHHWSPLLDSSELQPQHWLNIQATIEQHPDVDGVLIIHGTDTLSYTAAALSFMLNPICPVVVTGSMHPILEETTDAIGNLNLALQALLSATNEVIVALGQELLPGSRVTKTSTAKFDAFEAPFWQSTDWQNKPADHKININDLPQLPDVGVFTVYPGCSYTPLQSMITNDFDAIVINAFGNGNAATHPELLGALAEAKNKGIPVFVRSQCLEGEVDFGQYAASAIFADHDAVGCGQMTFEAVITKLTLLLVVYPAGQIKKEFLTPYAREWP